MKLRVIKIISVSIASLLLAAMPVFAHVAVKPSEAGVAAFQTFSVGVPTERDTPTVSLKLLIPSGLTYVTPNVKPGWTIAIKKQGDGENATVTEIDWTGGSIPAGQRDEFSFSAQVPAKETTLQWKAYQTYEDGTVVSWDEKPSSEEKDDDSATTGPYSETHVINDLKPTAQPVQSQTAAVSQATIVSLVALLFSVTAMAMQLGRKK